MDFFSQPVAPLWIRSPFLRIRLAASMALTDVASPRQPAVVGRPQ